MNIEGLRTVLSISNEMKAVKQGHIPKNRKTATYDKLELSMHSIKRSDKKMSESLVDFFNFSFVNEGNKRMTVTPNSIIIDGIEFSKEQIAEVPLSKCKPIRAKNNIVDIREGEYYQFNDTNGKPHKLACSHGLLESPFSEVKRGAYDEESYNLGHFWRLLSDNGTYISLYYSQEQQEDYLKQAGIEKGFFTVKVGEKQQDYFYTDHGNWGPTIIRKSQYDGDYQGMTGQIGEVGMFHYYKPGAVFEIAGEKYAVSEKGTLDIPYGIDLYDIKYPPKSDMKEEFQ